MKTDAELEKLQRELKKHSDPKRAKSEKKYLKSERQFYGVNTPTKRKIVKTWLKENNEATIDEISSLAESLWESGANEELDLAVQLLQYRSHELRKRHLPLVDKMINESTSWAHLDEIAKWLVGALIDNETEFLTHLEKWSESDNFWVRRAALLGQIVQFRRKEGDKDLFFKLAKKEFNEKEDWSKEERFFIRKAIGWVLREIAEKEPEVTYSFVKKHAKNMSGLTFKEATRKLPDKMQSELAKLRS